MSTKNTSSRSLRLQLPASTPHLCIAVLGLPSHRLKLDTDGRLNGVGKSCLCSRFVLPSHDDYLATLEDHSSQLSVSSFKTSQHHQDHFLYFGSVVKLVARRLAVFHVVEHTTFVDEALRPLPGGADYVPRATRSSLCRSGKLAYLAKLYNNSTAACGRSRKRRRHGFQERFPCTFDGHTSAIAGYVLVVDATRSPEEEELQLSLAEKLVKLIRQQPNPNRLVVAVTKSDECTPSHLDQLSLQLHRRLGTVAMFYVSARLGVSVDMPFFYLYSQALHRGGESPPRPPRISFTQARQARDQAARRATDEAKTFLGNTVNRFDMTWKEFSSIAGGSNAFVALFSLKGVKFCQKIFRDRLVDILRGSLRETLAAGLAHHPDLTNEWERLVSSDKCPFCRGQMAKCPSAEIDNLDTDTSISSDDGETPTPSSYYNYAIFDMLGPTRQHPLYSQHESATSIPLLLPTPQFYGNVQHSKGLIRRILLERAAGGDKMMDCMESGKSVYSPKLFHRVVSLCAFRNDHTPSIPSSPDVDREQHVKRQHTQAISNLLQASFTHNNHQQAFSDFEPASSPDFIGSFANSFSNVATHSRQESDSESCQSEEEAIGRQRYSDRQLSQGSAMTLRRAHSDPVHKTKRFLEYLQPKDIVRLRLKPAVPKLVVTSVAGKDRSGSSSSTFRGTPCSISSSCSPQSSRPNSFLFSEDTDFSSPANVDLTRLAMTGVAKLQMDSDQSQRNSWFLPHSSAAFHLYSGSSDDLRDSPLDGGSGILSVSFTMHSDAGSPSLCEQEMAQDLFKDDDVIYEVVRPDLIVADDASSTSGDASRCPTVLMTNSESSEDETFGLVQRMSTSLAKMSSSADDCTPSHSKMKGHLDDCSLIAQRLRGHCHLAHQTSNPSPSVRQNYQAAHVRADRRESLMTPKSVHRTKSLGSLEGVTSTVI